MFKELGPWSTIFHRYLPSYKKYFYVHKYHTVQSYFIQDFLYPNAIPDPIVCLYCCRTFSPSFYEGVKFYKETF